MKSQKLEALLLHSIVVSTPLSLRHLAALPFPVPLLSLNSTKSSVIVTVFFGGLPDPRDRGGSRGARSGVSGVNGDTKRKKVSGVDFSSLGRIVEMRFDRQAYCATRSRKWFQLRVREPV